MISDHGEEYLIQQKTLCRALQFIPAPTSPWLVMKNIWFANKRILLAIIRTIYLQYVFICT
jgi:hypothetical protein